MIQRINEAARARVEEHLSQTKMASAMHLDDNEEAVESVFKAFESRGNGEMEQLAPVVADLWTTQGTIKEYGRGVQESVDKTYDQAMADWHAEVINQGQLTYDAGLGYDGSLANVQNQFAAVGSGFGTLPSQGTDESKIN